MACQPAQEYSTHLRKAIVGCLLDGYYLLDGSLLQAKACCTDACIR